MKEKMKTGVKTIITGVVLFFLAAFVPLAVVIPQLILNDSNKEIFKVPGAVQVTADEPGRYYLWNEYQIVFEGKSYNRCESIPDGMEIKILNEETGEPFNFVSNSSISSSSGSNSKKSIGYIDVPSAGSLFIEISGGNDQRVFSFSQSPFSMLMLFVGVFILSTILAPLGLGLIIWGAVKFIRSKKQYQVQSNKAL